MSSDAGSEKGIIEDDYDYGDDVSIIDRSEQVEWSTIIIKIFLGLLFIGFATGCIIYSVITSDEYVHPPSTNSSFFLYNISQYCDNGTMIWVNRTGEINDYDRISTGISWLQDAKRERIYHRIGIAEHDSDWQETHYVFSNHTFLVNSAGCSRLAVGYAEYLRRLGLQQIRFLRTEAFAIEEQENVKVNYFEGEPARDILIEGLHPAIVRAYSKIDNSFDYGWEYIFAQNDQETGLFRKEYFFPEMRAGVSDQMIYEEVPSSCYKSST